jgi:hypothetical protein
MSTIYLENGQVILLRFSRNDSDKLNTSARYICDPCITQFGLHSNKAQQSVEQLLKNTEDQIKTVIKEQKTTK